MGAVLFGATDLDTCVALGIALCSDVARRGIIGHVDWRWRIALRR